jgi:hypothetical protein
MKQNLMSVFGWYGVVALLLAYALVSFNVLAANSFSYQILNITGALGITFEAFYKKDNPAAYLNLAWVIIGVVVVISLLHI